MKSMNWGKGISIAIVIFVIGILSMVSYIISLDFYLVNNNHYEEGVNYQQTIDSKLRADSLDNPVMVLYDEERLAIKVMFSDEVMDNAQEGSMKLYRPNDASLDRTIPIEFAGGNTHVIPMDQMPKGKWILTVGWLMDDREYVKEEVILN